MLFSFDPLILQILAVIVTVLLIALVILNYFDEANIIKRTNSKNKQKEQNERKLTDEEKIL